MRLDRLRSLPDCRALLEPLDHQGLLAGGGDVAESADEIIDIDNLAAELADVSSEDDITVLRHVRASTEKRVVQGVADRKPCEDFDAFKPLFEQVRNDLSSGLRVTRPFGQYATIEVGHWFIWMVKRLMCLRKVKSSILHRGRKMLGCVSFIRMVQKATYFGCHWFVLCIKTKQRVELPIQTWGLYSAML